MADTKDSFLQSIRENVGRPFTYFQSIVIMVRTEKIKIRKNKFYRIIFYLHNLALE